ncbi:nucleoid-associated protein YejK [Vibrio vulnificus]|uniref:nucleoid-associated protein YejK n=1 Tax=Vibrio vulnificus TaxID=672 RepID=UPI000C9E13CE|nr:nucleoid-associated protein YejK [Vibrio vulnificus]PNG65016.1 nucleoid-associated protein NdpA [Vibrio vulnificus]POC08150.1 nucleoid-associated protein YejK [Vibrio vulnificus]POC78033.1 nucleoid-associated protein YejK [Vibrio vulnificus]
MSISIKNIAIHQLQKNQQEELFVICSYPNSTIQQADENLICSLHQAYSGKTKGFGMFNHDSEFKQLLGQCRSGMVNFYDFSKQSAERLKNELSKYPFADEGTLIFSEYQSLATEYLMIGLIPPSQGMTVMDNLSLSSTTYLDIDHFELAAVIDLSMLEADPQSNRYLSFAKGRVGRRFSDFFLDFLQAEIGYNAKQQSQILMQAVNDFCSDQNLERDESIQLKKQVFDYCNYQIKSGEEVSVSELSGELPPNVNGVSFLSFTQEQGYDIESSFHGDSATIKKLKKFVGAGGGLNITFESLLLGERVFYDPETDTLTIKGTPPNLRDQLTRYS